MLEDSLAAVLPDLLRCNSVLEELDLGHNRLGILLFYNLIINILYKQVHEEFIIISWCMIYIILYIYKGFSCAYAFAESLADNRCLRRLFIDYNRFGINI